MSLAAIPDCERNDAALLVGRLRNLNARFVEAKKALGPNPTTAQIQAIPECQEIKALCAPIVAWLEESRWLDVFHECEEPVYGDREPEGREEC